MPRISSMPFSLQVRPGVATDAHALAALAIQVWLDTYATDGVNDRLGRHVLDAFAPSGFAALAQDPDATLLVAQNDAYLVGYALLRFDAAQPLAQLGNTELCTLYVQERFTGAGVGTALLRQARTAVAERTGADALWLAVNTRNRRACGFYEKHGFSLRGRTWFVLGEDRHENHVLAVS
ncbi:GNAT family N-acetyltransferase [Variovorax sp.]|uniref:GNAT family N-acetyltransferase n=1 Tax=Variovorax sp. TaxID=1871043 RepID=UPI003BA9A09C